MVLKRNTTLVLCGLFEFYKARPLRKISIAYALIICLYEFLLYLTSNTLAFLIVSITVQTSKNRYYWRSI